MIYTCEVNTPLGAMTATAEHEALTGLWFIGQKYYPLRTDSWVCKNDHPLFEALRHQLANYFGAKSREFDLPLAPHGSPFQHAVWDILLKIPYGNIVAYGDIARNLARTRGLVTMSAQAVGGAVGHNPISILIPCHRVVGSNRSLTGYAGGLTKKESLLKLEGVSLDIAAWGGRPDLSLFC
jgi:methylated-DNA-[protein]-cysteine S-methyltransferase